MSGPPALGVARGIEPVDGEELRAGKGGEALATTELERGGGRAPAGSTGWVRVAGLEDLPPGSALEVRHGRRVYALFRLGDSITCLDGLCPHHGGHLAEGGRALAVVTCPRLGCLRWQFDTITGACLQQGQVRCWTYEVRIKAGSLLLALGGPSAGESPRCVEAPPPR